MLSQSKWSMPLLRWRTKTPERFWQLAGGHMRTLYNLALRYTGNPDDAEDIVQECYTTAFAHFDQLRDERKIKYWLIKILRNLFLKSKRAAAMEKAADFDDGRDYQQMLRQTSERYDIEELYLRQEQAQHVQDLLNDMPENYATPLLLYYMEELSYQEIAQTLEVPIGTVMSRLARGKQMLKTKLIRERLRTSKVIHLRQGSRNKKGL